MEIVGCGAMEGSSSVPDEGEKEHMHSAKLHMRQSIWIEVERPWPDGAVETGEWL